MSKKGKEALLIWCQKTTAGYKDVDIKNFHTSWADGMAFCAMIHKHRPDLINYNQLQKENRAQNLTLAFKVAEELGIPSLLDVEDMIDVPKPEPFSVITYLSQYYHYFTKTGQESQPQPPSEDIEICAKCGQELDGAVIEVMNKVYHQECFGCYACGVQLLSKCLNVENNPYCETCGRKAFEESMRRSKPTLPQKTETDQPPKKEPDRAPKEKQEKDKIEQQQRQLPQPQQQKSPPQPKKLQSEKRYETQAIYPE